MEHSNFNVVDLSVIGILLLSGLFAFVRGLVREVLWLLTWVGAAAVAFFAGPLLKPWMHSHIKNETAAIATAYVSVFCVTLIVFIIISGLLNDLVRGRTLNAIDRSLGFVFGLVRGALVVCVLYLCLSLIDPKPENQPDWLKTARTHTALAAGADILRGFIPHEEQAKAAEDLKQGQATAVKALDDVDKLNAISTPVPAAGKDQKPATYGNDDREKMDKLIQQKEH